MQIAIADVSDFSSLLRRSLGILWILWMARPVCGADYATDGARGAQQSWWEWGGSEKLSSLVKPRHSKW